MPKVCRIPDSQPRERSKAKAQPSACGPEFTHVGFQHKIAVSGAPIQIKIAAEEFRHLDAILKKDLIQICVELIPAKTDRVAVEIVALVGEGEQEAVEVDRDGNGDPAAQKRSARGKIDRAGGAA